MHHWDKGKLLKFIMGSDTPPFNVPWWQITTPNRTDVWEAHLRRLQDRETRRQSHRPSELTMTELNDLLQGTKYGRRLRCASMQQQNTAAAAQPTEADRSGQQHSSLDDSDSDDETYNPTTDQNDGHSESSGDEDVSYDDDDDVDHIDDGDFYEYNTDSDEESGPDEEVEDGPNNFHPCMVSILKRLQHQEKNSKWQQYTVSKLYDDYLSSVEKLGMLVIRELDMIRDEIEIFFGKSVFNKSAKKAEKVEKVSHLFCARSKWIPIDTSHS